METLNIKNEILRKRFFKCCLLKYTVFNDKSVNIRNKVLFESLQICHYRKLNCWLAVSNYANLPARSTICLSDSQSACLNPNQPVRSKICLPDAQSACQIHNMPVRFTFCLPDPQSAWDIHNLPARSTISLPDPHSACQIHNLPARSTISLPDPQFCLLNPQLAC